ncbi:LuxR C-terminal-related transcriptional regulator [Chloroflexota bacterium]
MPATNNQLSEREQEILLLVATGASNKEIAKELYISTNTVKVHLRNIFAKIGVNSRTEAAMYAVNTGIVTGVQPSGGIDTSEDAIEPLSEGGNNRSYIALILFLVLAGLALVTFFLWRSTQPSSVDADVNVPTSQWGTLAAMPTVRSGLAVAVYENQIYAIAGDTGGDVTNVVERYDPETDEWTSLASKPTAGKDVGAAVIGGKIYVPGGQLASGDTTDILEIYNPRDDSWSYGKPLPEAVSAYAIAAYEGRLYLFGGWDGEQYRTSVYEYNPVDDTWMAKSPLSVGRAYAGAAVAGAKIYIMGGYDGQRALADSDVYLPNLDNGVNNPWNKSTPLPEARYGMGVTSIAENIYLVGGINSKGKIDNSVGFFTQTGVWQQIQNPTTESWSGLDLVSLGTKIYAVGGMIDEDVIGNQWSYQAIYLTVLPIIK